MNKRILCLVMAAVIGFGSVGQVLAASSSEVQKQQTETRNKLNKINKDIDALLDDVQYNIMKIAIKKEIGD